MNRILWISSARLHNTYVLKLKLWAQLTEFARCTVICCMQCSADYARLLFLASWKRQIVSRLVYRDGKRMLFENIFSRVFSSMSKFLKRSEQSSWCTSISHTVHQLCMTSVFFICVENLYDFSICSGICEHACDFTVCNWHVKPLSELTTHIVHSNCEKVSNCCADLRTCLCVRGQSWAPCLVTSTRSRSAERTRELATAANHWHTA